MIVYGTREEADRAGAEHQRRHGDEGIGGVQVAAEQEPGDDGAEAAAAQAPFVQQVEVALAPARGDESEKRDQGEEEDEDDSAVQLIMRRAPLVLEARHGDDHGTEQHPEELVPIEERHAAQRVRRCCREAPRARRRME